MVGQGAWGRWVQDARTAGREKLAVWRAGHWQYVESHCWQEVRVAISRRLRSALWAVREFKLLSWR